MYSQNEIFSNLMPATGLKKVGTGVPFLPDLPDRFPAAEEFVVVFDVFFV